eukprot:3942461-Alexandrium_andersonii.AAC.1
MAFDLPHSSGSVPSAEHDLINHGPDISVSAEAPIKAFRPPRTAQPHEALDGGRGVEAKGERNRGVEAGQD